MTSLIFLYYICYCRGKYAFTKVNLLFKAWICNIYKLNILTFMQSKYTLNIVHYLNLLGESDKTLTKAIERKLITYLEDHGFSEHRYKRYKTTKSDMTQLYHIEAEVLLRFFKKEFQEQIKHTSEGERLTALKAYAPADALDLYNIEIYFKDQKQQNEKTVPHPVGNAKHIPRGEKVLRE